MIESGVYKISCYNGAYYIGSTVDFKNRINNHLWDLENNVHHSIFLQRSWNKYGKDAFKIELIEKIDLSNLNDYEDKKKILLNREQFYLDELFKLPKRYVFNTLRNAYSTLGNKFTKTRKSKLNHKLAMAKLMKDNEYYERLVERGKRLGELADKKPCVLFFKGTYKKFESYEEAASFLNLSRQAISEAIKRKSWLMNKNPIGLVELVDVEIFIDLGFTNRKHSKSIKIIIGETENFYSSISEAVEETNFTFSELHTPLKNGHGFITETKFAKVRPLKTYNQCVGK